MARGFLPSPVTSLSHSQIGFARLHHLAHVSFAMDSLLSLLNSAQERGLARKREVPLIPFDL
jgi:hypothetical protein